MRAKFWQWVVSDPVRTACLGLAVLQVYVVFFPKALLMVWPDSIGYLGPAVDMLERGYFSHWYARGFVYPLFLLGVLSISPEPSAIVFAQRLLVMLTYVGLASAIWLLSRHAMRWHLAKPWVITVAAVFWLLAFILYQPVVGMAQTVMAETLFGCLIVMVLLGIVLVALPEIGVRWRMGAASIAVVLGCALVLVKPHWLPAAFLVPLVLPFLAPRGQRRSVAKCVGTGLLLSGLFLFLPEKSLQHKYDAYASRIFGPRTLFCNNADLIQPYLQATAGDAFSRNVAASLLRILSPEARAKAIGWTVLQFDGDKCMYGETAKIVSAHFSGQAGDEAAYYIASYLKAMWAQPGYIPPRLTRQFGAFAENVFGEITGGYVVHFRTVAESRKVGHIFDDWMVRHSQELLGVIELPFGSYLPELKTFYDFAGGLVLLLSYIAVCRMVVWRGGVKSRMPLESVFLTVMGCAVGMNLLIALVHTFDISRYSEMQAPLFSLVGFIALLLALRSTAPESEMFGAKEVE